MAKYTQAIHRLVPTNCLSVFDLFLELALKVLRRRCKSSHRRCSIKKAVLKNFAKFTGKHISQSLFFNLWVAASKDIIRRTKKGSPFY